MPSIGNFNKIQYDNTGTASEIGTMLEFETD